MQLDCWDLKCKILPRSSLKHFQPVVALRNQSAAFELWGEQQQLLQEEEEEGEGAASLASANKISVEAAVATV